MNKIHNTPISGSTVIDSPLVPLSTSESSQYNETETTADNSVTEESVVPVHQNDTSILNYLCETQEVYPPTEESASGISKTASNDQQLYTELSNWTSILTKLVNVINI